MDKCGDKKPPKVVVIHPDFLWATEMSPDDLIYSNCEAVNNCLNKRVEDEWTKWTFESADNYWWMLNFYTRNIREFALRKYDHSELLGFNVQQLPKGWKDAYRFDHYYDQMITRNGFPTTKPTAFPMKGTFEEAMLESLPKVQTIQRRRFSYTRDAYVTYYKGLCNHVKNQLKDERP